MQLKQVHILECGSGDVAINHCLINVCNQPPLTIRSGSGKNLTMIGLTICRRCKHGAKIVETIIELHGICHHGCSWLRRGNVVGMLVGSCMSAQAPASGSSRKPQSIVPKRHC